MPPFQVPEASEATEQGESIMGGAGGASIGGGGGDDLFLIAPEPASEDFLEQANDEVVVEGVVGAVVLLYVEFLLPSKGEVTAIKEGMNESEKKC